MKSPHKLEESLSRRERQIMDVIYARGHASAQEVCEGLSDPPSYSAVRTLLGILEQKGHLRHEKDGARFIYFPLRSPQKAAQSALRKLIDTFFQGSPVQAASALFEESSMKMSAQELDELEEKIKEARRGKRSS